MLGEMPRLLFSAIRERFTRKKLSTIGKKELSYGEWIGIISSLKEWVGVYRLSITGGEPFIRKDMIDIIRFCHKNGIRSYICTNASLLAAEDITALSGFDSLTLNVSLDGSTPETHDYLRGKAGLYQRVMNALMQFKAAPRRCSINIVTVLTGLNYFEIPDLVSIVHDRKLADRIVFQALDHPFGLPYDKAWFHKNRLWPKGNERDKLISMIERLIMLKKDVIEIYNPVEQLRRFQRYFANPSENMSEHCLSEENNFIINQWGDVLLCWNMAGIGEFKKGPEQIWNSASAGKIRKAIQKCRRTCRLLNCNLLFD